MSAVFSSNRGRTVPTQHSHSQRSPENRYMITLGPMNAVIIAILVELGLGGIVVASSVIEFVPINMSRLKSVPRS